MPYLANLFWKVRQQQSLLLEMLVAVCLAFLIWLYAHCRAQDSLDNVLIPISLQMPPSQQSQFELEIQGPRQATVSFAGPSSRIRELRRLVHKGQVKAVVPCAVPDYHLKDGRFTEKISVEPSHIAVPPGVRMVIREDGSQLQATFYRIVERQLPVRLEYPAELHLRHIHVEPPVVTVRGPQCVLEHARYVSTQPYDFTVDLDSQQDETVVQGQVDIATEMSGRPILALPGRVSFSCRVMGKAPERNGPPATPTDDKLTR